MSSFDSPSRQDIVCTRGQLFKLLQGGEEGVARASKHGTWMVKVIWDMCQAKLLRSAKILVGGSVESHKIRTVKKRSVALGLV